MKNLIIILFFILSYFSTQGQTASTEKVWRLNILNPGVELEIPTGTFSAFSGGMGVGYGGEYPDLSTSGGSGFVYIITPFLDLQQKWFYNLNRRISKNKSIENNSGNFVSIRFITRGNSITDNVVRTSDFDFAVGPTWGIQRSFSGNFHLLLDVGPQYYFDTEGNGNIFPLMVQLNLGFDL